MRSDAANMAVVRQRIVWGLLLVAAVGATLQPWQYLGNAVSQEPSPYDRRGPVPGYDRFDPQFDGLAPTLPPNAGPGLELRDPPKNSYHPYPMPDEVRHTELFRQTKAQADAKSAGCISCHQNSLRPA